MKLLIVESPSKTKTIKKYLGSGFEVLASRGHIRDLPLKELGIDTKTFEPTYVISEGKAAVVKELRAAVAKADEVLLATDGDREGEAIAWHLAKALGLKSPKRIRFNEITASALKKAVASPDVLNQHLVDAQQARRVLDRLVGFTVSPLLRPFGSNHSAGRVQSATLHILVKRELEREAFKVKTYWTLGAKYENGLKSAHVRRDEKGQLVDVRLDSEADGQAVAAKARGPHTVTELRTEPVERKPKAPFTTASLLQAASVALKFKPELVMKLAQTLFEGGHITYHRTDSEALSDDSIQLARSWISAQHPEALPESPPKYKASADAQAAHEAIRPTVLLDGNSTPEGISGDELALYNLIRNRFIASQMKPAISSRTTVVLEAEGTLWRAVGSVVEFPSFLRLTGADEDTKEDEDDDTASIPKVAVGDVLQVAGIDVKKQQTKPPQRFTEAQLVAEMKRLGIGRPSTYANTLAVLAKRDYTTEEQRKLYPTPRGRTVDTVLSQTFADLVAADYTAQMEGRLDDVEAGKVRWQSELSTWWRDFEPRFATAPTLISEAIKSNPALAAGVPDAPAPVDRPCPKCGGVLVLRQGKKGPFHSCTAYPACDYAGDPSAKPSETPCPKCGKAMEQMDGEYGPWARCLDRKCEGKLSLAAPVEEKCPICQAGMVDKGKFLSCTTYPTCKGSWDKEDLKEAQKAAKRCPKCDRLLRLRKGGRKGKFRSCSGYPVCDHSADA
ncbi:type I DNA topoisomerase [Myxococcus vastator]|uniref:type I DNA topoisomerase n=1 Tax=Myxococcus vastator TaxID=2709664 RepID=UPI0013CFBC4B|nr:type I DNA topoisomerase [Myxococcus vastator]